MNSRILTAAVLTSLACASAHADSATPARTASMEGRMTISNMSIEAGGRAALAPFGLRYELEWEQK